LRNNSVKQKVLGDLLLQDEVVLHVGEWRGYHLARRGLAWLTRLREQLRTMIRHSHFSVTTIEKFSKTPTPLFVKPAITRWCKSTNTL
jgi:hypothetical protein